MEKPREIAVRVLRRHAGGSERLETALDQELSRNELPQPDRALVQELVLGVVRWRLTLDWLIARKTQGRSQKELLQILLRLGLYQAFWLQRIPDHAVVHESVQLARELGCGPQSGFINAVLRNCLRERAMIRQELDTLKTSEPYLGYSHPRWLVDRWSKRWSQEQLQKLLDWNNTPAPVYARVNALKCTLEQLAAQFGQEQVAFTARNYPWAANGSLLALQSFPSLASLPSFQQGQFYVQDPSTLLAVALLDPQPGETILDLCAAPGGKTAYIAQLMNNQGTIVAEDLDPQRLARLRENIQRLGATCVRCNPAHASAPAGARTAEPRFQRILVDTSCSNTGVMRRRIELRWRIQPSEIDRLSAVQLKLLHKASERLQPGGVLVYSTCSLEPQENEELVERFVSQTPGFTLEDQKQLTPFTDQVDGAYVARLRLNRGGTCT